MTGKEHEEYLNLMDTNYPLSELVYKLDWTKNHLRNIKRTRKDQPNFYTPDAEETMKRRIFQLKAAIKKLSEG